MDHHLKFAEMKSFQGISHTYLKTMRHVVWGNLGIGDETTYPADTVLFVSNVAASNARRIANESGLADVVREVVRQVKPEYRFRYQRLEALSFENEVRLIRRTRYMAVLFGAAISNCRFLPPGSLVLRLHGALKGEVTGNAPVCQYRSLCEGHLGVTVLGYAVPGWYRRYPEEAASPDLMTARISPPALAHWVGRALNRSEWPAIRAEFDAAIRRRGTEREGDSDDAGRIVCSTKRR